MYLRLIVLTSLFAVAFAAHISLPTPQLDGRIVGGKDVDIEEVPYQLSLLSGGSHICGASIISADWVLTAAHCVSGSSAKSVSFRSGSSIKGSGGTVHQAKEINIHPNYDSWGSDYDYAVIKVENPFAVGNKGVEAIPLNDVDPSAGETCTVSGWGALSSGGGSPRQLQAVQVPLVGRSECQEKYEQYEITDRMICAGLTEGGKDSCQGDSGGPLVIEGKQAGVVSWGVGCAYPNYPGVYSNVAAGRQWIRETTGV